MIKFSLLHNLPQNLIKNKPLVLPRTVDVETVVDVVVVVVVVVLVASFSSFSSSFVTRLRKSCKIFCLVWGMVRVLLRATKTSASSPILDSRNLSLSRKTSRLTSSSFESSSGLAGLELEDSVSIEGLISLFSALKIGFVTGYSFLCYTYLLILSFIQKNL